MDNINRRKFLTATTSASAIWAAQANAEDQGDVARSHPTPLSDTGADRDPLGIRGSQVLTPESVRRAIEQGIDYLKAQQRHDGSWPGRPHYDSGLTPLCTLALLNAGCETTDPVIERALKLLQDYVPRSTYTASLQTMTFCAADPQRYQTQIARTARWLETRQHQDGDRRGMWSIQSEQSTDHADNSMSHFAILALNEAERAGVEVNERTWAIALQHWQETQNDDGSWGWGPTYPGSGSMTCAGLAALIITGGAANPPDAKVDGNQVIGCLPHIQDRYFEKATHWLERAFSVLRNPGTEFWYSYYMYALERAGRMSARRFIGKHDWFREGARALVGSQLYSGAWPTDIEFKTAEDKNVSTAFSLMFLAKGRWPIVMAHLERRPVDDWNRHRAAVSNLVGHLEHAWKRKLAHQIVDISHASVDELLESPILFLNGRDTPSFSTLEIKKLRDYIDRGGFVFAECCSNSPAFDTGIRAALSDIYPEPEYKLQLLPPDHPVWFAEHAIKPEVELWGIDVGCRTAVIYCPSDLSCCWELDRIGRIRPEFAAVQDQLTSARDIGVNIISYATGREVAFKNPAALVVNTGSNEPRFERGTLYAANVLHPGGCHSAPAALRNLLRHAEQVFRLPLSPEPREVRLDDADLFRYQVLFFHGRTGFELTPTERDGLREYVERGGTMIADAICSHTVFVDAFRREMQTVFPNRPLRAIPATDAIFTTAFGGSDIRQVSRRMPPTAPPKGGSPLTTLKSAPVLEAIEVKKRYAVLFSPYDLSCALETRSPGCSGYTRNDALAIAMNVLLYSLNQ